MTSAATISSKMSRTAVFRPRGEFTISSSDSLAPPTSGGRPTDYTPATRTSVLESRERATGIAQAGPQPERDQASQGQEGKQPEYDGDPIQPPRRRRRDDCRRVFWTDPRDGGESRSRDLRYPRRQPC